MLRKKFIKIGSVLIYRQRDLVLYAEEIVLTDKDHQVGLVLEVGLDLSS